MISSNVVLDPDRLAREIEYFGAQGEFVWDWETVDSSPGADDRGVPSQNVVTWVSMATHGRAIVIPMGHPLGTKIVGETKEPRADRNGKVRMFRVPVYEAPPEQLTRGDVFPELNKLFNDPDISQAAHGATFDAATGAKYNGGKIPAGNIYCTIVMRWLTNENVKRYGLKYCAKDVWGFTYDDEEVGRRVEKHPFGKVAHYAYCDAKVAWLEYRRRMRELEDEGLLDLLQLETDLTSVLSYMRTKGVRIDNDRLLSLRDELAEREERQLGEVWTAAGRKFNPNAPRQKQQLLFGSKSEGNQGLKPWKLTDSAKDRKEQARRQGHDFKPVLTDWSTDEEAIEGYRHTNPVVDKLLNWTETHKVNSTYVIGYLGDEEAKDKPNRVFAERIYPDFVQYGAATGRFSCRAPNLQNVPRPDTDLGKLIRGMFVAEPGRQLIVADYGQIELVLLAHFIGKGAFYDGFWQGIDPHTMTAAMALEIDPSDVSKDERQRFGKSINFACVPMASQALTRDGWKGYDEISVGDMVLANDGEHAVWTPVLEKVKYGRAPVVKMANSTWASWSTPNHRWVADRRTGRGTSRRTVREFSTTETMTSEHSIVLSAPLAASGSPVSPRDAAIIAWLHTDGHMVRSALTGRTAQGSQGQRRGFQASIFQKKERFVRVLDDLLADVPHHRYERPTGIVQWLIDPQFMRDLWDRARLDDVSLEQFVLGLGSDSVAAFADAAWQAEGWTDAQGVRLAAQNEGPVLDAMQVAFYLQGYDVTRSVRTGYTGKRNWILRMRRPRVTMRRVTREHVSEEEVWCIRTEHENWVMRQDDRIMLTGNTVYGAGISKLASMMGVSMEEAKRFKSVYDENTPEIAAYRKWVLEEARQQRPPHVTTLMGRKRRVPGVFSKDDGMRMYSERQLFNSKIQGSSADMTKQAMVNTYREIFSEGVRVRDWDLLLTVHDELVIDAPTDESELAMSVLVNCMAGPEMRELLRVPFEVDAKIVSRWSEAK